MDYDVISTGEQRARPQAIRKMDALLNRVSLSGTCLINLVCHSDEAGLWMPTASSYMENWLEKPPPSAM